MTSKDVFKIFYEFIKDESIKKLTGKKSFTPHIKAAGI